MGIKVTVIGTGAVGSAIAFGLNFIKGVQEVVLIDVNEAQMQGEALDISHGLKELSTTQTRVGTYEDCEDSEIIIITAGINRKVGQTREDLLEVNKGIVEDVMSNIRPFYKNSFVIVVSNPVDRLTAHIIDMDIVPQDKICGTGCMLDTSRCVSEIAKYLNVSIDKVYAFSIGTHGSAQQIMWDEVKIDGVPVAEYCENNNVEWNDEVKDRIHSSVTDMGATIISQKGRTQYGIAMATMHLVKALIRKEPTVVSVGTAFNVNNGKANSNLVYMHDMKVQLVDQL